MKYKDRIVLHSAILACLSYTFAILLIAALGSQYSDVKCHWDTKNIIVHFSIFGVIVIFNIVCLVYSFVMYKRYETTELLPIFNVQTGSTFESD